MKDRAKRVIDQRVVNIDEMEMKRLSFGGNYECGAARVGGATLWFAVITGPGFLRSHSTHCWMMRFDWRISSTRTR